MAKPKKPYPGMGPFVVLIRGSFSPQNLDNGEPAWEIAEGANSHEAATRKRRNWSRWPEIKIVTNNPGDPKETRY